MKYSGIIQNHIKAKDGPTQTTSISNSLSESRKKISEDIQKMENMPWIEELTDSALNQVYDEFEDDLMLVQALEQFEEGN